MKVTTKGVYYKFVFANRCHLSNSIARSFITFTFPNKWKIFAIEGKCIPSKYSQCVSIIYLVVLHIVLYNHSLILINKINSKYLFKHNSYSNSETMHHFFLGDYLFLCITLRLQILNYVSSEYFAFSFWNWMCEWKCYLKASKEIENFSCKECIDVISS